MCDVVPAARVLPDVADESNERVLSFPVFKRYSRLRVSAPARRGGSRAFEGCDCAVKVVLFRQITESVELVKVEDFTRVSFIVPCERRANLLHDRRLRHSASPPLALGPE